MLQFWRFFPQFRDFRATLGSSSLLRNFSFIPRLHFWCCPFCSACLFSSSLSPPVASLVTLAAGLHLCSSGCGFAALPGAPSCLCLPFIHLLICFAARRAAKFVSHRSGLVAVYMSKLGSWGENIWGYAGRDLAVVPCWWSLYLCVGFFLWRRSCVSSPLAGGGVGSYCASFGVTAQRFPGAPAVFRSVSCSWLPFWGSTPS